MLANLKTIAASLVVSLTLFAPPNAAQAQEEFLIEAAKQGGILAIKAIAGAAYDANCKDGKSPDPNDKVGSLMCWAVQSALDKGKAEFERDVRQGLDDIKDAIAKLSTRMDDLQAGQEDLKEALNLIALRLDIIPKETSADLQRNAINGLWRDLFTRFINGERSFSPERNLAMAHEIITKQAVHQRVSHLNQALIGSSLTSDASLIEQHFNKILATVPVSRTTDLEQSYLLMQSIMARVLLDQARGEIMYAWAASLLEADCTRPQSMTDCNALPFSSAEFRLVAQGHRSDQLAIFNRLVEKMILDRSDTTASDPFFLHHDAVAILAAADFFTAGHMRQGYGVRGRVISAGNAFDPVLSISGNRTAPNPISRTVRAGTSFDWWTKSANARAYRTVYFTRDWKTYDIVMPELSAGEYTLDTAFPWTTGAIKVREIDLRTGTRATAETPASARADFGSFLAIERAGGAYAMMREAWDVGYSDSSYRAGGTKDQPTLTRFVSGTVKYASKSAFDITPRYDSGEYNDEVARIAPVIFADAGKVTMHTHLDLSGYLHPDLRPGAINADVPSNGAVIYWVDFNKPPLLDIWADVKLRSAVRMQSAHSSGTFWGPAWTQTIKQATPAVGAQTHNEYYKHARDVTAGAEWHPKLESQIKFYIPTSGFDATYYELFVGAAPRAIWFTRE